MKILSLRTERSQVMSERTQDATKLRRAEVALEAQQRGDRQVTATLGCPACRKELDDAKWQGRSALRGLEDLPALEKPLGSS